jgi:hypothetical protein
VLVVFLDLDGVLNHGSGPWLPELVAHLNRITNLTGAKIVIHSSWRYARTVEELRRSLRFAGVHGEVIDLAPVPDNAVRAESGILLIDPEAFKRFTGTLPPDHNHERAAAIQTWLDEHPEVGPTDFVILDDASEMAHLRHRHLQTATSQGLTRAHAEEAIRMLLG